MHSDVFLVGYTSKGVVIRVEICHQDLVGEVKGSKLYKSFLRKSYEFLRISSTSICNGKRLSFFDNDSSGLYDFDEECK